MTQLIRLAFPVAMAHLGFITMGLIDLLAVRDFGAAATGAVGICSSFFGWGITIGVGLMAGMDFYVSTSFGGGRMRDCDRMLSQGLWLASLLGIPLTVILWLASDHLVALGVQPEVATLSAPFLKWIALSLLPSYWFCAFRNYLQAINAAWPPFVALLSANIANYFLNFVFIHGYLGFPAMGFEGAAVATLSVRILMAALLAGFAWHARKKMDGIGWEWSSDVWSLHFERMGSILRLGIPAAGYMMLEVGVFGLSTVLAGRLEPQSLAAHQIVLNLASATFMVPLGIGAATAVLVGQALGKGNFATARATGWNGLILSSSFMLASGLSFITVSSAWMEPFTTDAAVLVIGAAVLKVAAFFQISDGAQTALAGALRGMGNTRTAFAANFVGHWVFGLPMGLWLCFGLKMGVVGIWMGLAIGLIIVAAWLLIEWWRISHRVVREGVIPHGAGKAVVH